MKIISFILRDSGYIKIYEIIKIGKAPIIKKTEIKKDIRASKTMGIKNNDFVLIKKLIWIDIGTIEEKTSPNKMLIKNFFIKFKFFKDNNFLWIIIDVNRKHE